MESPYIKSFFIFLFSFHFFAVRMPPLVFSYIVYPPKTEKSPYETKKPLHAFFSFPQRPGEGGFYFASMGFYLE